MEKEVGFQRSSSSQAKARRERRQDSRRLNKKIKDKNKREP